MTMSVSEAVATRFSCRAYRDEPVSEETVKTLIADATRAPSGGNLQPWHIIALSGAARDEAAQVATQTVMANPAGEADEYPTYPAGLWDPYRTRRFEIGEAMYETIGIPREDKPARLMHLTKNFQFFGAPVGLLFAIDRRMGHGQWAHLGMVMQTAALLATERGLATCMLESWGMVRKTMHAHLALPKELVIYAGMALGVPDEAAAINSFRSARAPLKEVADFRGFD